MLIFSHTLLGYMDTCRRGSKLPGMGVGGEMGMDRHCGRAGMSAGKGTGGVGDGGMEMVGKQVGKCARGAEGNKRKGKWWPKGREMRKGRQGFRSCIHSFFPSELMGKGGRIGEMEVARCFGKDQESKWAM